MKQTWLRRMCAAFAAVAIAAGIGLFAQSTAAEAATYCGNVCNGKNPQTFFVNGVYCATDAYTAASAYNASYGITLQLRYSPTCRTVWARIYGGRTGDEYTFGIIIPNGGFYTYNFVTYSYLAGGGQNWSNMWNDKDVYLAACITNARNDITIATTSSY